MKEIARILEWRRYNQYVSLLNACGLSFVNQMTHFYLCVFLARTTSLYSQSKSIHSHGRIFFVAVLSDRFYANCICWEHQDIFIIIDQWEEKGCHTKGNRVRMTGDEWKQWNKISRLLKIGIMRKTLDAVWNR